jgi:N-acetylmuramoyl-L-alanine amidase
MSRPAAFDPIRWKKAADDIPRNPDSTQQWGTRDPNKLNGLVIHQALSHGTVEQIARYHIGPNHMSQEGLPGLAYTFAIRKNGEILQCWELNQKPWSQGWLDRPGDENAEFVSCCLEGMFIGNGVTDPTAGEPTLDQMRSALGLWAALRGAFGWSEGVLYGHFDFGKPSCPGHTMERIIRAVRLNAAEPVIPDASPVFSETAKRQELLSELGYGIIVDGIWGPESREALIRFQMDAGLTPDGVWGPRTQKAVLASKGKP